MLYLLPDGSSMKHLPDSFGVMATHERYKATGILEGRKWAMDNCCFTGKFDFGKMIHWLDRHSSHFQNCLFVVLPDVVGDAGQTLDLYEKWIERYRGLSLPVAFVAQDGQEKLDLPTDFDCLFIGGSTKFKLSMQAIDLIAKAKMMGRWVHIGRVNYWKRIRWAFEIGADSIDGTRVAFQRDFAIYDLKNCMNALGKQEVFWRSDEETIPLA